MTPRMVEKFFPPVLLTLEANVLFFLTPLRALVTPPLHDRCSFITSGLLKHTKTSCTTPFAGKSTHNKNSASATNSHPVSAHEQHCLLMDRWEESLSPQHAEEERGDMAEEPQPSHPVLAPVDRGSDPEPGAGGSGGPEGVPAVLAQKS